MDETNGRITPEELERIFDEGGDLFAYGDPGRGGRPGLRQRRVGVDLPLPMIDRLDARAAAYGVTRQALIKTWLAERLDFEDRLDLLSKVGVASLKAREKTVSKATAADAAAQPTAQATSQEPTYEEHSQQEAPKPADAPAEATGIGQSDEVEG